MIKRDYCAYIFLAISFLLNSPVWGGVSLSSNQGWSPDVERNVMAQWRHAPVAEAVDLADFVHYRASTIIQAFQEDFKATTGNDTLTLQAMGSLRGLLEAELLRYMNEGDRPLDREGKRVAAQLGAREHRFLENLVTSSALSVKPKSKSKSANDTLIKLPPDPRKLVLSFLGGDEFLMKEGAKDKLPSDIKNISSSYGECPPKLVLQQHLFSMDITEFPECYEQGVDMEGRPLERSFAVASGGSTVVTRTQSNLLIHRFNGVKNMWEEELVQADCLTDFIAISADSSTIITNHTIDSSAINIHRRDFDGTWRIKQSITLPKTTYSIATNNDGSVIVVGDFLGIRSVRHQRPTTNATRIYRYDRVTDSWINEHNNEYLDGRITAVGVSADGTTVVTGRGATAGVQIERFDGKRWRTRQIITDHNDDITSIAISADGATIVAGSYDGTAHIRTFDPRTQRWEHQRTIKWDDRRRRGVGFVDINPRGTIVVVTSFWSEVQVWALDPRTKQWKIKGYFLPARRAPRCLREATRWDRSVLVHLPSPNITLGDDDGVKLYEIDVHKEIERKEGAVVTKLNKIVLDEQDSLLRLKPEEEQEVRNALIRSSDLMLLLHDILTKNGYFPHTLLTINKDQLIILSKLPLSVIKILIKRYRIKLDPKVLNTLASMAISSPYAKFFKELGALFPEIEHTKLLEKILKERSEKIPPVAARPAASSGLREGQQSAVDAFIAEALQGMPIKAAVAAALQKTKADVRGHPVTQLMHWSATNI